MLAVPYTYAEWVSVLNILKDKTDDIEVINVMKKGKVEWQQGVAERFSRKLIDVINHRMNAATDKFQRDLSQAHGEDRVIIQALLALRKEMKFLSEAIDLPALPEYERIQYKKLVLDQANNMQKAIEDSAKNDRSGKLSSIVRNHKVNSF